MRRVLMRLLAAGASTFATGAAARVVQPAFEQRLAECPAFIRTQRSIAVCIELLGHGLPPLTQFLMALMDQFAGRFVLGLVNFAITIDIELGQVGQRRVMTAGGLAQSTSQSPPLIGIEHVNK